MGIDAQTKSVSDDDEYIIDLGAMAADYLRCVKKYWIHFLIVVIVLTAAVAGFLKWSYEPVYLAKITYAVSKTAETNVNAYMAKSLSGAVSTIMATADFTGELLEKAGGADDTAEYQLSSAYTEGANLFSISVTSDEPAYANRILGALEEIYPVWASRSNGTLELQTVDKSEAKDAPTNPFSLPKSMGMGALAGLGVCFVFSTWYALTITTIRKESDMKRITGKNCIATIPDVKVKKRDKSTKEQLLLSNKRIDWGFKQSILAAQSRIEKQMARKKEQVLLVTSTLPQEGKSVVTVNLALAFAKRDKKILVIDGDLRNPSTAKLMGIETERQKGLTDFFGEKTGVKDMIAVKDGVTVIGGGAHKGEASGILAEGRMEELMAYLRRKFDFIIIDTPPAHLFTDAALFEHYADCALYVVRYDMAEANEIRDGIGPFIRSDKLMGYIINRNPGGFSTYGKYGYSRYGHYSKYKRYMDLDETSFNTEDSLQKGQKNK